jgi:hypothetical protein
MRSHGDKGRTEQAGENRVLNCKHADNFFPAVLRWIQPGCEEIVKMKTAGARDNFVPTSGNGKIKQPDREKSAAEHD